MADWLNRVLLRRLALGATTAVAAAAAAWAGLPPQPAKPLDPDRYAGRWYELARLPTHIQADCASTTADWKRNGDQGHFSVVETCHVAGSDPHTKVWRASGQVIDPTTNAKIRLSFFGGLVSQEYWVLDRGDDYSWCILSTPGPRYLWILLRDPNPSPAQKAAVIARARAMGYDVSRLVFDQPTT